MGVLSTAFIIGSMFVFDVMGVLTKKDVLIQHAHYFRMYSSIPAVICAVSWFLYFAGSGLQSKRINSFAKNVFGIFYISTIPIVDKVLWHVVSPNENYIESSFIVVHCLMKCVCAFLLCALIDFLRRRILDKSLNNMSERIYVVFKKDIENKTFHR